MEALDIDKIVKEAAKLGASDRRRGFADASTRVALHSCVNAGYPDHSPLDLPVADFDRIFETYESARRGEA